MHPDGRFEFDPVSPGNYTLVLEAPRFGLRQSSELAIQILQKEDVSISGSDIGDLTLAALPLGNVVGRIELDHATPDELSRLQPGLTLAESFHIHEFKRAVAVPDGSFSFPACQPARLRSTAAFIYWRILVPHGAVRELGPGDLGQSRD